MSLERSLLIAVSFALALLWPPAARAQQKPPPNPYRDQDLATIRRALKSGSLTEKRQAALEVGRRAEDAEAAAAETIACLDAGDGTLRLYACYAVGRIGPGARAASAKVIGLLRNAEEKVIRQYAAFALGRIDPPASQAAPALIVATSDKSKEVRVTAISALGELGPEASSAIPRLAYIFTKTQDKDERRTAIRALGALGADPPNGLDALLEQLGRGYEESIVFAIGAMGKGAARAAPLLLRLFAKPDPVRRTVIAEALGSIRAKAAVPALEAALKDADINTRYRAEDALAQIRAEG